MLMVLKLMISLLGHRNSVSCADHECRSELVAEQGVDERIDGAVGEADEMRGQHREEEVLLQQEALLLHLRDEGHQVERRPEQQERCRNHHHHPRYL